jgi:flagellar biosynthetic protein FlhB
MAEEFDERKTEAPTQRRRDEARDQGQVAFSPDLAGSLVLLAGLAALVFGGANLAGGLLDCVRGDLALAGRLGDPQPEHVRSLLAGMLVKGGDLLGVFLALVVVAAIAAGAFQVGFRPVPGLLAVNWERLSPAVGWTRLGSVASVVRGLLTVLKTAAVVAVAWWVVRQRLPDITNLETASLRSVVVRAWGVTFHVTLAAAGTWGLIGVVDYLWHRWRLEQSLRMSREELKEEAKREEGDPQTKARVRRLQREAARKRMMQDVPRATVVVTNPTHLAVALRYERATMAAPRVVAKGAGFVAERIVALARRHAVPVVERKTVAQALFKAVKVGQEIPMALYHVVAEVLAYVFRLRAG